MQFVLFIGVIVAVLLLSFVLVSYSHNLFLKKTDVLVEVIQAADSALDYSFQDNVKFGDILEVPTTNDLGISITVESSYWGLLELRKAKAVKKKLAFEKLAFVGTTNANRHALYLLDRQRPLVLAGKTKITGTAYLPEQGVKMGNIYGNSYYASKLIYGPEKLSKETLPSFNEKVQHQIKKLTNRSFEPQGEEIPLKPKMVTKNSFKEPTKMIKGSHIRLENVQLSGNIILWATHKITVDAFSKLHDVVLLAPKIEVTNWTKGNFQAFASKSITVGKACELSYPTVLCVYEEAFGSTAENGFEPNISLGAYAVIRGMVIYQGKTEEPNRYKPHIKIDENTKILGEVYSTDNVELKGSVHGSVTAAGFVALENGNIYQNHIYNGFINSTQLPETYSGIGYQNEVSNQVAKWLY